MSEPQTAAEPLVIRRTLQAEPQRVFRAWTDPAAMRRWFCPDPSWEVPIAEIDLQPGGRYRIAMQNPEEEVPHVVTGVYREITPPERLIFTWRWESWRASHQDSVVTLEFHDRGGETELVLTHELLPDANAVREHGEGWQGCLARLEAYLG